jgi:hypothetical protein
MSVQNSQKFSTKKFRFCGLDISEEQIQSINDGKSVLIFYHKPHYSQPKYSVANSDTDIHPLYKGQEQKIGNSIKMFRDEILVIKKIAKKIKISNDKIYCGSITGLATLIDVFQTQSGEFYIENNLWTCWANSQNWNESVKDFSFERYEIESGDSLDEYNKMGIEKMKERKNFFQKTVSHAIELGLSEKQAIRILDNNNVTVLEAVCILMSMNIPKKNASKIANKAFAWAYAQVILGFDPKTITKRFDNLISACREYADI